MPLKRDELFDTTNPGLDEASPDPDKTGIVPAKYPPVLQSVDVVLEATDLISRSRVPAELIPASVEVTLTGIAMPRPTLEAPIATGPYQGIPEQTQPTYHRGVPMRVEDLPGPAAETQPPRGPAGLHEDTQPRVVVRRDELEDVPLPSPEPTMVTGRPLPPRPTPQSAPPPPPPPPALGVSDLPTPVKTQPALLPASAVGAALLRDRALAWMAALWCAVLFAAFQPGLLSADSVEQLARGLERGYGNLQPPLLSILFGELTRLAASPAPVLALQLALLASGLAALAQSRRGGTWASLGVAAVALLLPPVWAVAQTLWGEVWLAGTLLWAVVFLDRRRPAWALGALSVAVLLRYHALAAVLPLGVIAVRQLLPRARWSLRAPAVLAVLAGLVALCWGFPRLVRAQRQWPVGRSVVWDLIGIGVERPELYARSVLAGALPQERLEALYTPASVDGAFTGAPAAIDPELPARERPRLEQDWLAVVRAAPGAYLHHRLRVLRCLLSLAGAVDTALVEDTAANPWGFAPPRTGALFRKLNPARLALRHSPFFLGIGWASLGLLCAIAALALRRRAPLAFPVALSGLLLALANAVVSSATDFRLLFWLVIATLAAGLLMTRARQAP